MSTDTLTSPRLSPSSVAREWVDSWKVSKKTSGFLDYLKKRHNIDIGKTGSSIRVRGYYPSTPHYDERAALLIALAPGLVLCDPAEEGELGHVGLLDRQAGKPSRYHVKPFWDIARGGAGPFLTSGFEIAPLSRIEDTPMLFCWGYSGNRRALCISREEWERTEAWLLRWLPVSQP